MTRMRTKTPFGMMRKMMPPIRTIAKILPKRSEGSERRKIYSLTAIPILRMRKPRNTKRHGADLQRNSVSLMK